MNRIKEKILTLEIFISLLILVGEGLNNDHIVSSIKTFFSNDIEYVNMYIELLQN